MYRVTDVLVYRFPAVTIYLGFAFVETIFKLIINYKFEHQI